MKLTPLRQAGIALPVMLLMLLTMAITSIYLIKSVNSATITSANAAYESALVRAADIGLHAGYTWLNRIADLRPADLNNGVPVEAYAATFVPGSHPRADGFWVNAKRIDSPEGPVDYVIHRMCLATGRYDSPANQCVMTTEADVPPKKLPIGESLQPGRTLFAGPPQVHYLITARLSGPRGGNVVNQMVVLIGA